MGQVVSTQSTWDHYSSDLQWVVFSANMNKFLAIACLAAVAVAKPEAEADPALLYGAYGYAGLGHVGYPYAYGCCCWICLLQPICQYQHCWSCPCCCPSPSWGICRCWTLCCQLCWCCSCCQA